jgi:hypothetical protein
MLKKILCSFILSLFSSSTFCQDIITTLTGQDIRARIMEVTPYSILYQDYDNLRKKTNTILKADVYGIYYENGLKDIFHAVPNIQDSLKNSITSEKMLGIMAVKDADKYYKGYKPSGTITLVMSCISPLMGLVPAIAFASSAPQPKSYNYPDVELMKKSPYSKGYLRKIKNIKVAKVWGNWAIGLGVNAVAGILYLIETR